MGLSGDAIEFPGADAGESARIAAHAATHAAAAMKSLIFEFMFLNFWVG